MTRGQPTTRSGRWAELGLLVLAWGIGVAGDWLTYLNRGMDIPATWWVGPALWGVMVFGVHLVVRLRLKFADPVILPCAVAVAGIGLVMQQRLDMALGTHHVVNQLIGLAVGMAAFAAVLIWLRDYRVLQRFPYVLFLLGLGFLLMPLLPVIGNPVNGSRIWISVFGYSFQPAEAAKIILTLAFASYLADRSEVLQNAGKKLGALTFPRLRDLVPLLIMFAAALVVLVYQNDFGTAMLFFGLFVMMLYVATDQLSWVVGGLIGFGCAAFFIFKYTSHVQVRVDSWLRPFDNVDQNGQIIEGQFGIAWGGLFGRGWGLGSPTRIPLADTDFISAAIAEELGLVGLVAILLLYTFIVARGLKSALMARESFGKLLACGLSFVIVLQVFAIVGGVTRLLPLTGLTTPFLSRGGSSLLANWVIMALLMTVSHQARQPVVAFEPFVDLEAEETAVIDLSEVLDDDSVRPRVQQSEGSPE